MNQKHQRSWRIPVLLASVVVTSSVAIYLEMKKKNKKLTFNDDRHVYFIGGGLGSLAGAVYLIRDCHLKGENIHIIEGLKVLGEVTMVLEMPNMDLLYVEAEC